MHTDHNPTPQSTAPAALEQIDGYTVPVDPGEDLSCDSCQ